MTKSQLTLSYALERSTFIIDVGNVLDLIEWKTSCATPTASCICLPNKNPNCFGEIDLDNMAFTLLAMILYMQLHREMGVNSSKLDMLSDLGIRAMKVELKVVNILPETLDSSITLRRSSSMMS
jgi:hypothetical protein